MKRLIGYEIKECGRKEMILEEIDEKTPEVKAQLKAHAEKIMRKYGFMK